MDRWAQLAHVVGTALLEFASATPEYAAATSRSDEVDLRDVRGHRQRQVLAIPEMRTERGMTTGEVQRLIAYDQPNVYNTMHELSRKGLVERVSASRPQRWRRVDWQTLATSYSS